MDSQENALNQGTEEVKLSEEAVSKAPTEQNEVTAEGLNQSTETQSKCEAETYSAKTYSTKKEIIERLKAIVDSDDTPEKAEVDHLKTVFYKLHFAEREAQQRAYIENGGDPEKYQVLPDEDEEVLRRNAKRHSLHSKKRNRRTSRRRRLSSRRLKRWLQLLMRQTRTSQY